MDCLVAKTALVSSCLVLSKSCRAGWSIDIGRFDDFAGVRKDSYKNISVFIWLFLQLSMLFGEGQESFFIFEVHRSYCIMRVLLVPPLLIESDETPAEETD